MKNLFSVAIAASLAITASAQEYEWVRSHPGSSNNEGKAVAVDGQSNVYSTGYFGGTIQADANTEHVSNGSHDFYLSKHSADGDLLWSLNVGGSDDDYCSALAATNDGGVIAVGEFEGTVNFNPLGPENSLTSAGAQDVFVAKYATDGMLVWAKRIGASNIDRATGVSISSSGEIRAVGTFAGVVDFDPGDDSFEMGTNMGGGFVLALDADGDFIWVNTFENTSFQALGSSISAVSTDINGNTIVGGSFKGTIDFLPGEDGGELTSLGLTDCMIAVIDADGEFQYGKSWGNQFADFLYGLDVDAQGNIYSIGSFAYIVDFDPGEENFDLEAEDFSVDFFVSRLNADGSFGWAFKIGDTGMDEAYGIDVAGSDIYITGVFAGADVDFDPGMGEILLSAVLTSPFDPFLLTADTDGNVTAAISFGGEDNDIGYGVAMDPNGAVYVVGRYHGTADFDPSEETAELTTQVGHDPFLVKFAVEASPMSVGDLKKGDIGLSAYPVPADKTITVQFNSAAPQPYAIFSLQGEVVQRGICANQSELKVDGLINGVYILKIGAQSQRIVVVK